MTDLDRLARSTSEHEGFRSLPYRDGKGLWTFGKGRCLETHPLTAEEWRYLLTNKLLVVSITEDGADWLMWRELTPCEMECERVFSDFWSSLNDARQNVLVEMCYQMSVAKVRKFVDMLAAIRAGDWERAAAEGLDSDWAREDSPRRARVLMQQLLTGEFPR